MKKEKIKYKHLKDIYISSSVSEVYKQANQYMFTIIVFSVFLLINISSILFEYKYSGLAISISGFAFLGFIVFIMKRVTNYFIEKYPEKKDLINNKKGDWIGCRSILFDEKINTYEIDKKRILKKLKREIKNNKFNILNDPVLIAFISTGLSIFILFIEKIYDKYDSFWVFLIAIFFFFITIRIYKYGFLFIKTKEQKLKEFKQFIEMINNKVL
jgi:hypothetical protein